MQTGLERSRRVVEMRKYRHEFKYLIHSIQLEELRAKLSNIIQLDSNVGEKGYYEIRSLYFDDYNNTCYYENENGTDPREKYRIRLYNGNASDLKLELKRKQAGKTLKTACTIDPSLCRRLMDREHIYMEEADCALMRKFCLWQDMQGLEPKIIVEYDRIPFVCEDGNVRITLDMNMRSSARIEDFMQQEILCRPIMPKGMHLLEVKYDEFLPDYIYKTIQMRSLKQTAFSKYYLCRKYSL